MKPSPTTSFVGARLSSELAAEPTAPSEVTGDVPGATEPDAPPPPEQAATRDAITARTRTRLAGRGRDDTSGTSIRCGSADPDEPAFEADDDEVQGDAHERDGGQRREHQRGVEERATSEVDEDRQALAGACPLPDDGAHDGESHPDAEATEDVRERCRDLERGQDLPARGPEAPPELDQPGVDGPDADHRGDRDREEDDQRADDDLADEPGAEPKHEQRREDEDRDRLRGHEIRRCQPLEQVAPRKPVADQECQDRPDDEAAEDLDHRRLEVWPDRAIEPGADEPAGDGLRCGQDERREIADDDHELPG